MCIIVCFLQTSCLCQNFVGLGDKELFLFDRTSQKVVGSNYLQKMPVDLVPSSVTVNSKEWFQFRFHPQERSNPGNSPNTELAPLIFLYSV